MKNHSTCRNDHITVNSYSISQPHGEVNGLSSNRNPTDKVITSTVQELCSMNIAQQVKTPHTLSYKVQHLFRSCFLFSGYEHCFLMHCVAIHVPRCGNGTDSSVVSIPLQQT